MKTLHQHPETLRAVATRVVGLSVALVVLVASPSVRAQDPATYTGEAQPLQRVTLLEKPEFSPFSTIRWSWSRRATTAFSSIDATLAGIDGTQRASELLDGQEWDGFAEVLARCLQEVFSEAHPGVMEVDGATGEGLQAGEALLQIEVGNSRSEYVINEREAGEDWRSCRDALLLHGASLSRVDAIEHPFWRAGQWGTLVVYTEPGARLYLNGRDTGRFTPLEPIRLPPGRYEVERRSPDGAVSVDTIYVMVGQTTRLSSADSR